MADVVGSRVSRTVAIVVVLGLLAAAVVADRTGGESASQATPAPAVSVPGIGTVVASWYCAAGSANPGGPADELLYVANIDDRPSTAVVTVMAGSAGTKAATVAVPARSTVPVRVGDVLPAPEPGVLVETTGGRTVVSHGLAGNGDVAIGPCASAASSHWYFGAGTTDRGAQLSLALFNPSSDDAILDVSFLTGGGPLAPEALQGTVVPRGSRVSIPVQQYAGHQAILGTVVHARRGQVVAEQALTLDGSDGRKGLAVTLGAPALARRWDLATGLVGAGRTQQVVVANPGSDPVAITVLPHLDGAAQLAPQPATLAPQTAAAVDLSLVPPGTGFSLTVTASAPVVVETIAATTTPNPPAVRGIESNLGQAEPAREWVLAPGRASPRSVDFVDVLNPGSAPASFTVTTLRAGTRQAIAAVGRVRIPAGARAVLDLRALQVAPDAILVLRGDRPLVVEREASGVPGLTLAAAVPAAGSPKG